MEEKPKIKITLYLPDGTPQEYFDCTVGSSLVPELEFYGTLRMHLPTLESDAWWRPTRIVCKTVERYVHITSTTLPYIIETDECDVLDSRDILTS